MEKYKYTYLFMGLLYLIIWLFLFLRRKDLRKEMILLSLASAIFGPLTELIYFRDWWNPITITGSVLSIEPILFGFCIGGIAAVIYEEVFGKKLYKDSKNLIDFKKGKKIFILELFGVFLLFGLFFIFHLNSLLSTIIAFGAVTIIILYHRRDLFIPSILSGILICIIASIVYSILNIITPNWIEHFLLFNNTPRIIVGGIPIDDLIWYFGVGMMLGPLYEYYKVVKLK
jgi:hypothetical protein